MSAIDTWAKARGTTGAHMTALLKSEYNRLGRTDPLLDDILKEDAVISEGTSTALSIMLDRAVSGDIAVSIDVIASVFDVDKDDVIKILNEDRDGIYQNAICDTSGNAISKASPDAYIASDRFFDLIRELRPNNAVSDGQPVSDEPAEKPAEEPVKEQRLPATQRVSRRRTKYQLARAAAMDLLSGSDTNAADAGRIKNVRSFLLSLPDYRPQDIAVMSDAEVMDKFETGYATVKFANGSLVLGRDKLEALVEILTSHGAYYVPSAETNI